MYICIQDRLCNLRFAANILLIAISRRQLTSMLRDLIEAVQKIGLEIHAGKTKILSNVSDDLRGKLSWVEVAGTNIETLKRKESTTYLGWELTLGDKVQDAELQSRMNRGWSKFMAMKKELSCERYPLRSRLRLFNAVVNTAV